MQAMWCLQYALSFCAASAVLVAASLSSSQAEATEPAVTTRIPVQLEITADDALLGQFKECLERELRKLPDVNVDPSSTLRLRLIALEQETTAGDLLGYLLYVAGYFPGPAPDSDAVAIKWETLLAMPPDFPAVCKRIGDDFNNHVLESVRRTQKAIREGLSKSNSK